MTGPQAVPSPASRARRPTVAVLGAGIAGLTAAQELVERGFEVTVYEPRTDERVGVEPAPPGGHPPVKLGGLAASQYSTPGPTGGSAAQLRPFPGRRGLPRPPKCAVAGEHGFRFFPAYYLHIWDLLQRIPLYVPTRRAGDEIAWLPSSRTVMDNVRRVITQATILHGRPSLIFPREPPRSLAELLTVFNQYEQFGFTPSDVATFGGRILRYLVTSPLRRASELQNLSAYDFFIGRDAGAARRYTYSPQVEALIRDAPKVLAAFDSHWGDARTNITTFLQLLLQMDRRDNKADGVLNGPTTRAWFDHWYRHLVALGVRFVPAGADHLAPPATDRTAPAHLRPRAQVVLSDGTRLAPDYVVVAVDAPNAERITGPLRAAGIGGAVAGLDGFATSAPPPSGPLEPEQARTGRRRDPFAMAEMGRVPWDRFQTLAGIQFYFDTEFQLVRGHVLFSDTEWGLSSINQHGLWEDRPSLARDGYVSVLSVDIGDVNRPSRRLVDEHGRGKAARDCTADELAAEVWRQIADAITDELPDRPGTVVPWPAWYALDRNLVMAQGPGQGDGPPVRNEAPYLIPIVGDWPNRPGGEPWNPHGSSWITRPTLRRWRDDLQHRDVWQARHGGYQVHLNSVVFAGTWTKTFTRLTSMEAACESARHAVNAVLDHYLWVETGGTDLRDGTLLDWRFPFGFLDQGYSTPIRQPTPAGDYCFVFDIENREPLETRNLRNLDSQYCRARLPHPLDTVARAAPGTPAPPAPPPAGGPPMTSPIDYTGQLLTYLQAWRRYLEQATGAPGHPTAPVAPGPPPVPAAPAFPPAPPAAEWPPSPLAFMAAPLPMPYMPAPYPPAPPGPMATPMPAPTPVPAPPGPPTPPMAAPPGLVTGPPIPVTVPSRTVPASPAPPDPGLAVTPPATGPGDIGRSAAPGSLFGAGTADVPPDASAGSPPASAFRWSAQEAAGPAAAATPATSLFSDPAAAPDPVPAAGDGGPLPWMAAGPVDELVPPTETTGTPPAGPPVAEALQEVQTGNRVEDVAPPFSRAPGLVVPEVATFSTEIVGKDPRA